MEAFSRKTDNVCNYCQKECTLNCSLCKSVYYCNAICQKKDWVLHNDSCSILEKVRKNIYVPCYEERKAVLLENNQQKRDLLMKRLLHKTRNRIVQINKKLTSNFVIASESTILMLYDYSEEYLYNIILMARIYFHRKDMGNAKRALEFFNNELNTICRKNDFEKYFLSRFVVIQRSKRYQNFKKYINKYLQLYKCIFICALELMNMFIIETVLHDYIKFIEGLLIKVGIYEAYFGWIALRIGEIFIQRGMVMNTIEIYSTAIMQIPKGEKLNLANHYTNCIITLFNNISILYFSIDDYEQSYESINQSIKLLSFSSGENREPIINEQYIFKYISLYQLKAELEIDSKHYVVAYNNIKALLLMINSNEEVLKKKSLKEYNKMICLLNELLNKIDQGLEEKDASKFELKTETSIEEDDKINHTDPQMTNRETEQTDFEKFLLFLIKLSMYQLRILNQTQPNPKTLITESLPIFYSDEFKLCLTNGQRLALKEITIMNLIRNKMLNDPALPISISNLNFIKFFPERVAQFLIEKDSKEQFPNLVMLLKRFFKLNEIQLRDNVTTPSNKYKHSLFIKRPNFSVHSETNDIEQLKIALVNAFKEGFTRDIVEISRNLDDTTMLSLISQLNTIERNELIKNLVDQIKRISINEK